MLKRLIGLAALGIALSTSGCETAADQEAQRAVLQRKLDEIQRQWVEGVRIRHEEYVKQTNEYLAARQAEQDAISAKTKAEYEKKHAASQKAQSIATEHARICLREKVGVLAAESQEASNLVALAVENECEPQFQEIQRALSIESGDFDASQVEQGIKDRLIPAITAWIVTARATPQAPAQQPPKPAAVPGADI